MGWVDVVFGTHNLTQRARAPAPGRDRGPRHGDPRRARRPSRAANPLLGPGAVRELPYAAWVTIQTGCDNSCAFCIVPVGARARGEPARSTTSWPRWSCWPAAGVTEVTLLGQNVNSYGRDITRRRPLFADLLRAVGAVDGIGRVRFTSPHPKDLRPETIAAMAETPEVCEQLHLPAAVGERPRCCAPCAAGYTARALPRAPGRGPGRRRRPGRDDRHHRGLPRRDRGRLRGHAGGLRRGRLRQRLHLHLLAAPGHPGGGHGVRASCRPTSSPSASSGSRRWSTAPPWPGTRPGSAAARRCSSRASAGATPSMLTRPHPPGQAGPLPGRGPRRAPAARARWPGSR